MSGIPGIPPGGGIPRRQKIPLRYHHTWATYYRARAKRGNGDRRKKEAELLEAGLLRKLKELADELEEVQEAAEIGVRVNVGYLDDLTKRMNSLRKELGVKDG